MQNKDIRIIFMGTPEFAVPSLEILVNNGYNVVAVITTPDKPAGRGLQLTHSPVKEAAIKHNIPVLQPEKLKDESFIQELIALKADLQVVVAFRMLPEIVWNMPPKGTFNLHASLLPQYRGAAPINWAIMNGETKTGATTFFLQHEIDTGDIIDFIEEPIYEEDNIGSLYERLMNNGAELVLKTVNSIANGDVKTIPQITENVDLKAAPKIFKEHCQLDWNLTAIQIHNKVRGLSPYPAAFCKLNNKNCKVFATQVVDVELTNAFETDQKTFLHVKTSLGTISILELQLEGKKRIKIDEFLRGTNIMSVE